MPPELLPDNDPSLDQLAHDLERARAPSYPLLFAAHRLVTSDPNDPSALLDALAAAVGYASLGSGWIAVPRRIAAKILVHLIGGELAYPAEIVPPAQAELLAGRFLALFPDGAHYYTNGAISGNFAVYDAAGNEVLGWRSLSAAPLDNGVIALGGGRIAMLWAEDAP